MILQQIPEVTPRRSRLFMAMIVTAIMALIRSSAFAAVPGAPTLVSPGSTTSPGPVLTTLTPTLTLNAVATANNYGFYVLDTGTGALVYDNDAAGNNTSVTLPAGTLTAGHGYRWNGRASNASGFGAYSGVFYFQAPAATNGPSNLVFGFDSSAVQQHDGINWISVASSQITYNNQNYPLSFVLLRASKGNSDVDNCRFKDPDFDSRIAAAASAGLVVGGYHVAGITNIGTGAYYTPASEADFFVGIAGNWIKAGNLRPCLDVEDHSCGTLSTYPGLATWVDAWCQEVKTLTGVTPIIYCNGQFAALLQSLSSKYDLWIAKPGMDPSSDPGMAPWNTQLIQYSWNGSVSGVDVPVDMDVFQGNQAQFLSSLVISGNLTPPPPFFTTSSIQGGMFVATVAGLTPGETMITWASTNLVNWSPVATNVITGSTQSISIPINSNIPSRYFRTSVSMN